VLELSLINACGKLVEKLAKVDRPPILVQKLFRAIK